MNLIELLSASDAGKYNKSPSGRKAPFQRNENHKNFFALLKSMNIPLWNIEPADMTRADNLTPVLGLTWTLIQHFEEVEHDELLDWVNKQVTNDDYDVKVTNWHTSFNDGLALCAVLNKHSSQVTPLPPAPTPTPHPPPSEAAIRPRPRPARELALPTHPTRPHPSARTAPTITPSTTLNLPSYLPRSALTLATPTEPELR